MSVGSIIQKFITYILGESLMWMSIIIVLVVFIMWGIWSRFSI